MEAKDYRCIGYCDNCPFKDNGKSIRLKSGRVKAIKEELLQKDTNSFTCHKTLETERRMCFGAFEYLKKKKQPNIMMRLAVAYGFDSL